jgi:hypothetical protein
LNSTVLSTPPLPQFGMLQEPQETGCKSLRQGEVGEIAQAEQELDDAIREQELTFDGPWVDEVLARSGAYFDVPAAAVRRRMRG